MDQLLVKKNSNITNFNSNTSTIPIPGYDQLDALRMGSNNENIEDLFDDPINISRTKMVNQYEQLY